MIELHVVQADHEQTRGLWQQVPNQDWLDQVCRQIEASFDVSGELAVMLSDDNHLHDLNLRFRNQDKATNVLSFPDEDEERLGDLAISYETLKREAEEQKKPLDHHFRHLAMHGILHLLGYDHESDEEADEMESLEIELLAKLHIPNPYKEPLFQIDG